MGREGGCRDYKRIYTYILYKQMGIICALAVLIAGTERLIDFQILPLWLRWDTEANKIINVLGVGQIISLVL